MRTPRSEIAGVLANRTLKHGAPKKFSREVAAYLLDEGRTGEIDSLLRDIQADWAAKGYVEAIAVSAFPLSSQVKIDIKRRLRALYPRAKHIVISESRDPEVIGGVRIKLADQQLDLTIESKLHKFKQLTAGDQT